MSAVAQLLLQSLQRLQELGATHDGSVPPSLGPSVATRAVDVRIPLSEVVGRSSDRGNPRRPGAMRGVGSGGNPDGTDAMNAVHHVVMPCSRRGCAALVDRVSAIKAARADGRERLRAGDGCAGRRCAARWQPARFCARQLEWSADLLTARRLLIRRPALAAGKTGWLACTADTEAAARRAARSALAIAPRCPPQ